MSWVRALAVLAVVLAPLVAMAAAPEAVEHVRLAKEHYRAQRFDDAAAEFTRAHQIDPDPRLLFNVAKCLEMGGRYPEAIARLQEYLTDAPDAANARAVEITIAALRPKAEVTHTELEIRSEPGGASVWLDDATEPLGVTPVRGWVAHGAHTIRLTLDGHVEQERALDVSGGSPAVMDLVLVAVDAPGVLRIEGGAGVDVLVDEVPVTTSEAPLAPGVHQVTASVRGVRYFARSVRVEPGGSASVQIPPAPTAEVPTAGEHVTVAGEDAGGFEIPAGAWVLGGVAVAAAVTGATFGGLALSAAEDARDYGSQVGASRDRWTEMAQDAEDQALISGISLGVAGAAAVGAGIWMLVEGLEGGAGEGAASWAPIATDGGAGLAVSGRF
jgi:hypothetical protein